MTPRFVALAMCCVLAPPAISVARAQQEVPNVPLRTQSGTPVRLYDDLVKGKVVLINFFFTSCTSICPTTTANLKKVEARLAGQLGRDVVMISISVDPETDTPAVLEGYARRYRTGAGWYFLTGTRQDIDLVRRRLGMNLDGDDKNQHTGVLIYGSEPKRRWAATPATGDPEVIARNVLRLLPSNAATRPLPGR